MGTKDKFKAGIILILIVILAAIAETITVNASESIMWEEANGHPIFTTFYEIYGYTKEDIDLLARMAYAEARGEGEQGMRYCVACAINRKNHPSYPDSLDKIIVRGQFAISDWASVEAYDAVYKEIAEPSDTEIMYFRTGHYHDFGTPMFQYKSHYFSKH